MDELDAEVFNGIEYITEIDISDSNLRSIDMLLTKFQGIERLTAYNTKIELADLIKIGKSKNLNTISIEHLEIKKIHHKILSWLLNKKDDSFKIESSRYCKIYYEVNKLLKLCFRV